MQSKDYCPDFLNKKAEMPAVTTQAFPQQIPIE